MKSNLLSAPTRLWRSFAAFVLLLVLGAPAQARLSIEITQGVEGALPIAVVPFASNSKAALPEDVAAVVSNDLARSGQFAPLALEKLPERPSEGKDVNFAAWRGAGSDNLVIGRVDARDGRYVVPVATIW